MQYNSYWPATRNFTQVEEEEEEEVIWFTQNCVELDIRQKMQRGSL